MGHLPWMLAVAVACSGCRQLLGLDDLAAIDGSVGDAGGDASGDAIPCDAWNPPSGHFAPCAVPPGPVLVLGAGTWTFDTDTGALTGRAAITPTSYLLAQPAGPQLRILSTDRFELVASATLRVIGSHPLAIASWGEAELDGLIEVASAGDAPGAGANGAACTASGDGAGLQDSGGGGGGGFGATGGAAGDGKNNGNPGGAGGLAVPQPQIVDGGCPGGRGGASPDSPQGGTGGGAIEIASPVAIRIAGSIHAGGAGGRGGTNNRGGGGGGSGGYIGLDAPIVSTSEPAILAANGGGGGAGCSNGNGEPGEDGKLGDQRAAGGAADSCAQGVTGGGGGARLDPGGAPGQDALHGGGGGGGSVGHILVWGASWMHAGTSSPMVTKL